LGQILKIATTLQKNFQLAKSSSPAEAGVTHYWADNIAKNPFYIQTCTALPCSTTTNPPTLLKDIDYWTP
jgi:hypothetical protein